MAYYRVVDDFRAGMPQTVLSGGLRPRGIACHTTEGAPGEAGALGTIQFLIDRADRNASYSELWYPKSGGFEARRIVRPDRAAHSMNPAQPPWAPDARVRRILGDRWGDPNAYSYAVSIAGTTAGTVPALIRDPGFMEGARRRYSELLAQFKATLSPDPMFNHGEGQNNRSDWGPLMRPAILEGDEMAEWVNTVKPVTPYYAVLGEGTNTRPAPTLSSAFYQIPAGKTVTVIVVGEVQGDAYPANSTARTWLVYQQSAGGFWVVHKSQPRSTTPLAREVIKEVVKEVPTGITQADVDKAVLTERQRLAGRSADLERDRILSL